MEKLQNLVNDIAKWSDATFGDGQRNPAILYHLKKEVPELIEAIEIRAEMIKQQQPQEELGEQTNEIMFEYADCFMLLFDSARVEGLNVENLLELISAKLEINKKRKWGKPDENGVVEHVR